MRHVTWHKLDAGNQPAVIFDNSNYCSQTGASGDMPLETPEALATAEFQSKCRVGKWKIAVTGRRPTDDLHSRSQKDEMTVEIEEVRKEEIPRSKERGPVEAPRANEADQPLAVNSALERARPR
jgi:hypothetical protein